MKTLLLKLLMFLPIIITIPVVNFYVDPACLFRTGYISGMAEILAEERNVENISNYDERLLQQEYINLLSERKEIIVLGSSRALEINSKLVGEKSFFNSAVSGASLEDYMAIYAIYRSKRLIPSKVILGVDPWIFNKYNGQKRWESISDYYYNMGKELGCDGSKKKKRSKFMQLISLEYFQASVDAIVKARSNNEYFATDKTSSSNTIKLWDGSLVYGVEYRNRPQNVVEEDARAFVKGSVYGMTNYYKMDSSYIEKFEKFVNLMKEDGVEVLIYLPPYHPSVYGFLIGSEKHKIIVEIEEYLTNFANDEGLQVVGSYNPLNESQHYNLTSVYFHDGMHPKSEALKIIFSSQ